MTPEQRTELCNLVAEYDGCTYSEAFEKLQAVVRFVEKLEYEAAPANTYDASWRDEAIERKDRD